MITAADCRDCGACCQTMRAPTPRPGHIVAGSWVNCTAEDVTRMPRRVRLKLVPVKTDDGEKMLATPLMANGMCGFLRGTPGERVSCAIYDVRPTLCAKYQPGSEYCRASRREIGLPA